MKLIADCGSTKIDWCLLDGKKIVKQVFTTGMNAMMLTEEEMAARIADELMPQIDAVKIDEIYYYGAGCLGDEVCGNVRRALAKNINASIIEVDTDLLAAARALCGRKPGIACIMGTGSNSCYYDGQKIVDNVSPLGYILGDEGSGAVLGKLLVGDVLKNQIPKELAEKFLKQYDLDRMKIIRRVYKEPQANRFLASLTPFLIENIEEPAIHRLVLNSFKSFFVRNIANYDQYRTMTVNFVGSIAYYYKDVLTEAAASLDCKIGNIIKSPMEGLIEYHSEN
ncbi:MAG: ATPase [Muribaculaceae bacterium]|nr:ATPase [Muribaculaceae bacterium]